MWVTVTGRRYRADSESTIGGSGYSPKGLAGRIRGYIMDIRPHYLTGTVGHRDDLQKVIDSSS